MASSAARDPHHLFCEPASGLPLSARRIADLLRAVIEEGDSGHSHRAHDVRGRAASLAFLLTHSLDRVKEGGQWGTASCFVARCLSLFVIDTPCGALTLPQPKQSQREESDVAFSRQ